MVRIYKSGPAVQDGQKVVEHKANAVSTLGGSMSARFLTLFFALGFSALTIASDGDATRVRNVVLVHGAWADGSSWAKVIPLLEKAGLNVVAVQNPLTSLSADVATTRRAIPRQDGPVSLAGHSYGGMVITEAGAEPKVVGLVYVAAFAPDAGQALGDLGKEFPPPPGGAEVRPDSARLLKITTKDDAEGFAQGPLMQ